MKRSKKDKLLFVERARPLVGCWRFMDKYQRLDQRFVYAELASGEGEVVRHLCGDNRCVNPLHLVRGSDIENAEDEIVIRDYSIKVLEEMIGEDYSKYPNDLAIRVLLPRVRRAKSDHFKTMSEVAMYGREMFRREYTKWMESKVNAGSISSEQLKYLSQTLDMFKDRDDITIIYG